MNEVARKIPQVVVLSLGLITSAVRAQTAVAPRQYRIDLPLIDAPFNAKTGWAYPSMAQSVALSKSFYDVVHATVEDKLKFSPRTPGWPGFWKSLAYVGADSAVLILIPPGEAWLHEEYHRAVMAHRGIASFNDVYRFKLSGSVINVSQESDADLIRLKEQHPEDQVRLAEAGMEGEHMLLQNMQSEAFFLQNTPFNFGVYVSVNASVIGYLDTCNSTEADAITEESNTKEGDSVSARDFIGLDCNGWIRDLNRPSEPYAERGVHPSGVGIDRYTTYSELSQDEKRYLDRAEKMSYLNLVDPFLLNRQSFTGPGDDTRFTITMRHMLTSFGMDTSARLLWASPALKAMVTIHGYQNFAHLFPGIEVQLLDAPGLALGDWQLSVRAQAWQQPKNFAFRTSDAMAGGLLGLRVTYTKHKYQPYAGIVSKSRGWVAGEVDQDRAVLSTLGLIW